MCLWKYEIWTAHFLHSTESGIYWNWERRQGMKEKITDFLFVVFKFVQNPKDKKQPKQQLRETA